MLLDQISLLTAIGFSSAALTLTLLVSWFNARADRYLLSWGLGMGFAVIGLIAFTVHGEHYEPPLQLLSFVLLLAGFAFIYAGAGQFRTGRSASSFPLGVWAGSTVLTATAFVMGFSGVGTAIANLGIALLLILASRQYWAGRAEAPMPLIANAVIYGVVALSFALCGIVLLDDRQFVLTALPQNWAEDINAIAIIIGLTCVGALSVMLNQMRVARHHRHLAMTDQLTGMLNRRALFDALAGKPIERGNAVIMFDIDHFKAVNDRLGHAIGDLVLQRFAQIIQTNVRTADMSARLGGEEFCIVLGPLSSRSAANVAERIRAAFEATAIESADGAVTATVSAGLAFSASADETFEQLLGRADDALYKAKSAGRNRVHTVGIRLAA